VHLRRQQCSVTSASGSASRPYLQQRPGSRPAPGTASARVSASIFLHTCHAPAKDHKHFAGISGDATVQVVQICSWQNCG
jgi:hypothetical protein